MNASAVQMSLPPPQTLGSVQWITFYTYAGRSWSSGPAPDREHETLRMEANITTAITSDLATMLILPGATWSADAMKENVERRRAGTPDVSVLASDWRRPLQRLANQLNGTQVTSIFLGDELLCRGVPLANWSSVASLLKASLPSVFIMATECRGVHYVRGVKPRVQWICLLYTSPSPRDS